MERRCLQQQPRADKRNGSEGGSPIKQLNAGGWWLEVGAGGWVGEGLKQPLSGEGHSEFVTRLLLNRAASSVKGGGMSLIAQAVRTNT